MRRPAAPFSIALALGAAILVPGRGAQADPTAITTCQTINQPGSYKLVGNLAITGGAGCLIVAADDVTIDLAGFSIIGQQAGAGGIQSVPYLFGHGIAVRNGSISGFVNGVALDSATSSIVEGMRVSGTPGQQGSGIIAQGIVKGNVVSGMNIGIQAITGTIADNYVENFADGIFAQAGSTLIGNTVINNNATGNTAGLGVTCPSNVINNTATAT